MLISKQYVFLCEQRGRISKLRKGQNRRSCSEHIQTYEPLSSTYIGSKWQMLQPSFRTNTEHIVKTNGSKSQKMQQCAFKAITELIKNTKLDVPQFVQVENQRPPRRQA